jgi:hypothetical protein
MHRDSDAAAPLLKRLRFQAVWRAKKSQFLSLPKRRFWKEEQKDAIRISKEALFKGVRTRFGLRTVEKCFLRNPDFVPPSKIFVWGAYISALGKRRMKSVDKDIDENNKQ